MAAPAAESTKLAWRWVIEALADTKEVETSILIDLVKKNPEVLKDSNVNERVALRYLKEFVDSDNGKSGVSPSTRMGVAKTRDQLPEFEKDNWKVDVESRSVDVLYAYIKKKRRHPDDFYNHEIRHFISQKRATLPKSYLAVLDESIDRNCTASGNDGLNNESQLDLHNDKNDGPEYVNKQRKLRSCSSRNPPSPIRDPIGVPSRKSSFRIEHHSPKLNGLTEIPKDLVCSDSEATLSNDHKGKKVQREPADGSRRNRRPMSCNIPPLDHEDSQKSSGDQGDSHDQFPVCNSFYNNHASEKDKLVSSQIPCNSLNGDGPQQKLCSRCDESGQLLHCRGSTCPIAVHEGCLGFPFTSQDLVEFYCPFCAYIQAATSYYNARRKVSSCKKALFSFMGWGVNYKTKSGQRGTTEGSSSSEKDAGECYRIKEHVKTNKEELQQTREHVDVSRKNVRVKGKEHIVFPGSDICPPIVDCQEDTNIQQEICTHGPQQGSDIEFVNNSNVLICNGVVKSNDKDNNDTQPTRATGRIENDLYCHASDLHQLRELDERSKNDIFHCQESNTSPKMDLHVGRNLEDLEESDEQVPESGNHHVSLDVGNFSTRKDSKTIEEDIEISDHNNNSCKKQRKLAKRSKRYANPVNPSGRRNRLPWTAEEEEILKDGVQKFYDGGEGNISWTQILEYGRHIFHKTRYPRDLKDKWRNIRNKEEKA